MNHFPHILADDTDSIVKALIFVVAIIFWGISSLVKMVKKGSEQQKEKLRQVREAIERSQALARQQVGQQPQRPPVQLAPEIARRVPPPAKPIPRRAPQNRPATNYNAMAKPQPQRRSAPPPPLPPVKMVPPTAELAELIPELDEAPHAVTRKASTVDSVAIRRWLKPATLRQQFILTELFQPPLALRPPSRDI